MRLWCALAASLMVLAAGTYRFVHRPPALPRLPAGLAAGGMIEPEATVAASAAPRSVSARVEAVEPIMVTIEPLELPTTTTLVTAQPGDGEASALAAPGPRPESSALRMPYADEEEVSEFATLLQQAAEFRQHAGTMWPRSAAEESEVRNAFDLIPAAPAAGEAPRCPLRDTPFRDPFSPRSGPRER